MYCCWLESLVRFCVAENMKNFRRKIHFEIKKLKSIANIANFQSLITFMLAILFKQNFAKRA